MRNIFSTIKDSIQQHLNRPFWLVVHILHFCCALWRTRFLNRTLNRWNQSGKKPLLFQHITESTTIAVQAWQAWLIRASITRRQQLQAALVAPLQNMQRLSWCLVGNGWEWDKNYWCHDTSSIFFNHLRGSATSLDANPPVLPALSHGSCNRFQDSTLRIHVETNHSQRIWISLNIYFLGVPQKWDRLKMIKMMIQNDPNIFNYENGLLWDDLRNPQTIGNRPVESNRGPNSCGPVQVLRWQSCARGSHRKFLSLPKWMVYNGKSH